MVPLSVLDLATVASGSNAADALADTTRLATVVEQLGYRRLWVAEHHGMPMVASSAPAVLVGHLADATTTLRVGAGGVMLPNHRERTRRPPGPYAVPPGRAPTRFPRTSSN
jgi:luciferase family oxidoreductase group 1